MNKIKKFWKKLKYWQKGSIIGFSIGLLPILSGLLSIRGGSGIFLLNFVAVPSIFFFIILYQLGLLSFVKINAEYGIGIPLMLGWFLAPLVYLVLGALLGKIYQIYKNKKNE